MLKKKDKGKKIRWLSAFFAAVLLFLIVPETGFDKPLSTVVFSDNGDLLGARVADDGQWRFQSSGHVPEKYKKALLAFEDRWFYYHPGINPVSILRAAFINLKSKKVLSGGSTITMQLARMSRENPARTLPDKLFEMCMALKMSAVKSKSSVLKMYASNAPFGGNVVGIDAASWRYFSRPASELSWAEAATLAVLPNSPALIFPGRNHHLLKQKRDKLLKRLLEQGEMDVLTYRLSLAEPLPSKPLPLPQHAPHVCDYMHSVYKGQNVVSTIEMELQSNVKRIVSMHHGNLSKNHIYNLAALVVEVETGNMLAYVGNAPDPQNQHGGQVDVARAARSSGSILKPFLYAAMLQQGELLPDMLLRDLPVNFSGYSPQNFDYTYSGAVPAKQALSRSLNIPAVEMLHQFGEARFLDVLRNWGFTTFPFSAEHYGLSLILGGGESSLFELAGAYASMARVLNNYNVHGAYNLSDIRPPLLFPAQEQQESWGQQPFISAAAAWFTLNALEEVNRPQDRAGWWNFSSSGRVAWKTGTSFGFRDAWAVAITPGHVVAVWAGNASGEGRPGLTGTAAAAPVLFDVIDLLPSDTWFQKPVDEITYVEICDESGHRASHLCPNVTIKEIPLAGLKTAACPYHKLVHLSADRRWRVNSSCYPVHEIVIDSFFVLSPGMEWFYRKLHPGYRSLPPLLNGCETAGDYSLIELLYPRNLSKLYIPYEMDGKRGRVVFEAAHRNPGARLFWHLNEEYIGETRRFHQMALSPTSGTNRIVLFDEEGNSINKVFVVLDEVVR